MPRGKQKLFKANLVRRRKGKIVSRREAHTQALSKDQAARFIHFKNRGYSITRLVEV